MKFALMYENRNRFNMKVSILMLIMISIAPIIHAQPPQNDRALRRSAQLKLRQKKTMQKIRQGAIGFLDNYEVDSAKDEIVWFSSAEVNIGFLPVQAKASFMSQKTLFYAGVIFIDAPQYENKFSGYYMVSSPWGPIPLSNVGSIRNESQEVVGHCEIEFDEARLDRMKVYEDRMISSVEAFYFDLEHNSIVLQCTLAGEPITIRIKA